jgi:hypothetical protein
MSSLTIIQEYDKIIFATETAFSFVLKGETEYRKKGVKVLDKVIQVGKDSCFISGMEPYITSVRNKVNTLLDNDNHINLDKFTEYLRSEYPSSNNENKNYSQVGYAIMAIKKGKTHIYQACQGVNDYTIYEMTPKNKTDVNLIVAGVHNEKLQDKAIKYFSQNYNWKNPNKLIEFYQNNYCNSIGQDVLVFCLDSKGCKKLKEQHLIESNISYIDDITDYWRYKDYVENILKGGEYGYISGSTVTGATINGSQINGTVFTSFGYRDSIPQKTVIDNGFITTNYVKVKPMNGNDFSNDSAGYTYIGAGQIGTFSGGKSVFDVTNGYLTCENAEVKETLKTDNINANKFNGSPVYGDIITSINMRDGRTFPPDSHRHDTLYNYSGQSAFFSDAGNFACRNGGDLGSDYYRWRTAYLMSSPSVTSDRNSKHDIENLPEVYKELISRLTPVRFKYNEGTSDRYHTGFIAQDVEQVLSELGIDSKDFGGLVKAPIHEIRNADGEYDTSSPVTGYLYMLRHDEFISPIVSVIQDLQKEVAKLKEKVSL